jgi:hypothetical protein
MYVSTKQNSSRYDTGPSGTHLETLVEDDLLPLQTDVFGPLDETGQVLLGRDVTAWPG